MYITFPKEQIDKLCVKWQIKELSIFGSALREDFSETSDIDILVSFNEKARTGYFELAEIHEELKNLLGRDVDLISKRGIEASKNRIRKNAILNSARIVYAA